MKNKKLFAILTLVCFMFTLMPMAAFAAGEYYYAELTGNTAVAQGDNLTVTIESNDAAAAFYVFAYMDGAYSKVFPVRDLSTTVVTANGVSTYTGTVAVPATAPAGNYTLYVVDKNTEAVKIMENPAFASMLNKDKAAKLLADATTVAMLDNAFSVKAANATYTVTVSEVTVNGAASNVIKADAGYTSAKAVVKVVNNGTTRPVYNADVDVYTDSYGLQVTKLDAKTKANGEMEILITGTIPGTFNVYASYEGDVCATPATIVIDSVGVANVTVTAEPQAPVNVNTATAANSGIEVLLTDVNGTEVAPTFGATGNHKVTLVSAPAGFDKAIGLKLIDGGADKDGVIVKADGSDLDLDVEGTYVFRIALQNGAVATASVTTAEFDKAVAIKFVKAPVTVALNADNFDVNPNYIVAVDANGVTTPLTVDGVTLKLSVNGKAVENFDAAGLDVKDKEDYIGSQITVIAVYKDGAKTFTTTNTLTVVDEAASVVYRSTDAEVGVNNVLYATVLDANGKVVTLGTATPQAIVIDMPENAVANAVASWDAAKQMVRLDFLASVAGEYKVQTIVEYGTNKYISDIETITVGGGEGTFKDVIVMSIGAKELVKNAEVVAMPAAPEIVDSRTMVPARAGLEAFGAVVVWDEATQSVTAELNGVKVVMVIGEKAYTVNGKAMVGDAAPYITEASTMVPVSFFTNAFGIVATPIYDANGVCDVLFTK